MRSQKPQPAYPASLRRNSRGRTPSTPSVPKYKTTASSNSPANTSARLPPPNAAQSTGNAACTPHKPPAITASAIANRRKNRFYANCGAYTSCKRSMVNSSPAFTICPKATANASPTCCQCHTKIKLNSCVHSSEITATFAGVFTFLRA